MNIWATKSAAKKGTSYLAKRFVWFSILLALALAGALACVIFSVKFHWPAYIQCIFVVTLTIIIVIGASRIGQNTQADTKIFYEWMDGNLYVFNAARYVSYNRHTFLWGYIQETLENQKYLNQLFQSGELENTINSITPKGLQAIKIVSVNNIKSYSFGNYINCIIENKKGKLSKRTFLVENGYENYETLLLAFERRLHAVNSLEIKIKSNVPGIVISSLLFVAFTAVTVCAHPEIAIISSKPYFIYLFLAFAAFTSALYFILKQKRGE